MFVHLVTLAEVFLVLLFLFCVMSVMWLIALLCCSQTEPEMICRMKIKGLSFCRGLGPVPSVCPLHDELETHRTEPTILGWFSERRSARMQKPR